MIAMFFTITRLFIKNILVLHILSLLLIYFIFFVAFKNRLHFHYISQMAIVISLKATEFDLFFNLATHCKF